MKPVLIRQHVEMAPPGNLARWLEARGLEYVVDRSWAGTPLPDPTDHAFVASLGHELGAGDTHDPAVAAERDLLSRCVDLGVPVLGLCYGAQVLAAVLGADVGPAEVPELGWLEIETDDPACVPPGPWLAWHFDRFTTPPGATEVARSAHASQAFRIGPHLGVQFHPEATVEIVAGWARASGGRLAALGIDDGSALLSAGPVERHEGDAAAFELFDAFVAGLDQ
jgi:GMP synthase-like glutamine amidotransferase